MSAGLELRRLVVLVAGRRLLDIDDFAVAGGTLTVVAGSTDSGKTVLAAALAGSMAAAGDVMVLGRRLGGSPAQRRRAGLAVALRDGTRIAGCTVSEALRVAAGGGSRAREALHRFPALARRGALAAQLLSGGEQQMLQIACAWAATPAALVLDTPTVGLADDVTADVVSLAREEAGRGAAVLWLEADRRAAPEPAAYRLVTGRLEPAAGSATAPG